MTIVNNTVFIDLTVAKREGRKCSHHKKRNGNYVMEALANATKSDILKYVKCIKSTCVHLKFMSITSQLKIKQIKL